MRLLRKLLRANSHRCPRVIVTDKLRSYAAARRVVIPAVVQRQHRYLNNRAENSHEPTPQAFYLFEALGKNSQIGPT